MNKRQIIASLNNIANTLDNVGLYQESSAITNVMKKLAQEDETSQKLSPFDLGNADISNIMDDDLNKSRVKSCSCGCECTDQCDCGCEDCDC